ncbi:hypothetical protein KUCAC02_006113 [Chaenocephalus aceratus]|uniref:Uncharacterized protein n=1 Tax=Chaenocephalus aceratus TaxID=36190 RepID=A0ACB9WR46_CHAAC|nr:hypothetical protein KUCAC02_006113 [Chaenocephalus aceratus]
MAKVTTFCSLLHSTCGLKEAFEGQYGANRSIPSAVSTRWNSTLRRVEAVTDLDPQSLNTLLEAQGHKGLCLSAREWSPLKELVEMLAPFLQATDLTQREEVVTKCSFALRSLTQQPPQQYAEYNSASGRLSESSPEVTATPFPGDLCKCAPVERVFSHGGLIMRPHRARLSARTLSSLIFLKCNHSVA